MSGQTDLRERRREVTISEAWREWDGFVTLAPGEVSAAPKIRLVEGSSVEPWSFAEQHCQSGQIEPIGCYFLRNVTYAGMLYPFEAGRMLVDGSHLSRVSVDWLGKFPQHRPGGSDNNRPVTISDPVIAVVGPGHQTYGHWIIDFLPRLAIARDLLGDRFAEFRFLLLTDTPQWGRDLLMRYFGIGPSRLLAFEFAKDEFICERLCYPTFAHSYPFFLHSFLERFYRSIAVGAFGDRRLCVQRRSDLSGRNFPRREEFERLARREGFELVDPQGMPIDEQSALFRSASVVIGEYGSALHNCVFSAPSTVLGVLNAPGVEQTQLCAAFGQPIVYAVGSGDGQSWTLSDAQFASFFETIRRVAPPPPGSAAGAPYASLEAALVGRAWRPSGRSGTVEMPAIRFRHGGHAQGGGLLDGASWSVSGGGLLLTATDAVGMGKATMAFTQKLDVGDNILLFADSAGPGNVSRLVTLEQSADPEISCQPPQVGAFSTGYETVSNPDGVALRMGRFCTISSGVSIASAAWDAQCVTTHPMTGVGDAARQLSTGSDGARGAVVIGNDVRIEHGAILKAGVEIGDGAIVRAGAVVGRDIPPYAVVEGNPARVVGFRFAPDHIARLIAVRWWDWPIERLQAALHLMTSRDIERFLIASERTSTL